MPVADATGLSKRLRRSGLGQVLLSTHSQWVAVKIRWGLRVDSAEKAALIRYADSCPNITLTVTRA